LLYAKEGSPDSNYPTTHPNLCCQQNLDSTIPEKTSLSYGKQAA